MTDTLPAGLTPTAASGSGWTTQINGSTVTATRSDALAVGTTYPALTITVNVAANVTASLTNTATVSGGGELNTANDTASDSATITPMPDLTIAKSHSGTFKQSDTGDTYTITVGNAGSASTSGTVTVTDTLPTGLTPTAASGTGWTASISGSTVTATRNDALSGGASYSALTVTVSVAANAAASVTNTAAVAGGGEINTANDSASDTTTITSLQASLAGFVYLDTANSGQRLNSLNVAKPGIVGVTVKLLSQSAQGSWGEVSGKSPIQTGANGSYSFTGLPAGDYRIQVVPPANFIDGQDTAGKIGGSTRGTVTQDQIEVQLNGGENGTDYNFAVQGLRASLVSNRLFLASTPAVDKLLAQFASSTTAASVTGPQLQATSAAQSVNASAPAMLLASNAKPSATSVNVLMARYPAMLLASHRR